MRDTLRFFELAEPTFRYTLREAIGDGHLVPYRIYKAMTVKTAAEDGFEVARKELDWTAMDAAARAELEKLFEQSDPITVDPRALVDLVVHVDRQERAGLDGTVGRPGFAASRSSTARSRPAG